MNPRYAKELGLRTLGRWSVIVRKGQTASQPAATPEPPTALVAPPQSNEPAVVQTPCTAATYADLAQEVVSCNKCGLCKSRNQTVLGKGKSNITGGVLFVGEGPGKEEDKQGIPFVGPAGKLLDKMLQHLDLSKAPSRYVTNIIKCRPPDNRNPTPREVAACMPYLERQIELLQPCLLVALGAVAANALLDNKATLGSLREQVHEYRGIPLHVHYHPAYLLRRPEDKRKAWRDLLELQRHLDEVLS